MGARTAGARAVAVAVAAAAAVVAPDCAPAAEPLGVYIAEPVVAATGKPLEPAAAGAVRAAIETAFKGLCRPIVEIDPALARLPAKALLALARGKGAPKAVRGASARTRDLIAIALRRAGSGTRIEMSAIDLKTRRARATAAAQTTGKAGLARAARAAATALRPGIPCPVWRGEIVLINKETRADRRPGYRRTGRIEWTLIVKVSGKRTAMTGRYAIAVRTRTCARAGAGKRACTDRRLDGAGPVEQRPRAASSFELGGDGRYTVVVGDAFARVRMTARICKAAGGACRSRRFAVDQLLDGARGHGWLPRGVGEVIGAATFADTKTRQRSMSWQLELRLE